MLAEYQNNACHVKDPSQAQGNSRYLNPCVFLVSVPCQAYLEFCAWSLIHRCTQARFGSGLWLMGGMNGLHPFPAHHWHGPRSWYFSCRGLHISGVKWPLRLLFLLHRMRDLLGWPRFQASRYQGEVHLTSFIPLMSIGFTLLCYQQATKSTMAWWPAVRPLPSSLEPPPSFSHHGSQGKLLESHLLELFPTG